MNQQDWKKLYDSLDIEIDPGTPKGVKPTPAVISAYEAATGFKLPEDYCDFIQVFGPGELGRVFRIKAPGYPTLGFSADLDAFNSGFNRLRDNPESVGICERKEQFKRLHFFAATDGGEAIAWDPSL
jgi:hypothetical protein